MSDRLDRLEELMAQLIADTAEQKRIQAQRDAEMLEWRQANEERTAQRDAEVLELRRIQAQQSMDLAEWRLRQEAQMTRHEQTFEEIGRMFADLYTQLGNFESRFDRFLEEDLAFRREVMTQILGLQTENRRILGILEGRQDNGHEPLT